MLHSLKTLFWQAANTPLTGVRRLYHIVYLVYFIHRYVRERNNNNNNPIYPLFNNRPPRPQYYVRAASWKGCFWCCGKPHTPPMLLALLCYYYVLTCNSSACTSTRTYLHICLVLLLLLILPGISLLILIAALPWHLICMCAISATTLRRRTWHISLGTWYIYLIFLIYYMYRVFMDMIPASY